MREVVHRLENTSSQLRVRLAITFALAFAVVEVLTGKLEAIGFGFLIPGL